MTIKKTSQILLLIFVFSRAFGQGEIPVNMYTGQPSIGIPITSVTSVDVSVPVALTYDINSATNKGPYGYGWNLAAGGSVSREVRGLPDDFGYDDPRKGWFYNNGSGVSTALDIQNFTPTADLLATTATDETTGGDNAKLYSFGYLADTEPDLFHYSFGDFSGSFVFGNDLTIRTIPYHDILIEPTYASGSDKKIVSFKITTNDGYVYTFADQGEAKRTAGKNQFLNNVHFLSTEYELYKANASNTFVTYNAEWNLTRIDSPNGAYVTFSYAFGEETSSNPVRIGFYKELDPIIAGSTDLELRLIYTISQTNPKRKLTTITGSTGELVTFTYNSHNDLLTTIKLSDTRKGSTSTEQFIKKFDLAYYKVDYGSYSKNFLTSITELSGCDRMPPVKFEYNGITGPTRDPITLYDAWGYEAGYSDETHSMPKVYVYPSEPEEHRYRLNPIPNDTTGIVLNGVNRNATGIQRIGSLLRITYPHGSVTSFGFGPNRYLDPKTNLDVAAGGLRIESIQYFDGFNPNPVTKLFEYKDPATGKSSGKLLRQPVLAFPAFKWKSPYNLNSTNAQDEKNYADLSATDRWKYLVMRTESDIAPPERTKGNTVGYAFVTVRRPGSGYATFEYHTPAPYAHNDTATTNLFARPNISPFPGMGIVSTGGAWRYPHTPNSNYDFERGLIWRKSDYKEGGKLVQKTETTYQYVYKSGTVPAKVWGLTYDKLALCDDNYSSRRIYMFGKYALLTDVDKVPSVETVTLYDANETGSTKFTTASTEYIYGSANHKFVTEIKHTSADGNVRRTRLKYPKDFPSITSNAENAVLMITYLRNNFRHGAPVETITTLQKPGDYERVTGAGIVNLDPFGGTKPLPESVWSISTDRPIRIDSFYVASAELVNGTYKLQIDARYLKRSSNLSFTSLGQSITSQDAVQRMTGSTRYGSISNLPVVQIGNTSDANVAFSDFESLTGVEFTSATPYYGQGRTGANAFYPGVMLTRTLTKASVDNYLLSFWIKSNAAVDFTIDLKHATNTTTYATINWSVPSSGGSEFRYVQKLIPVTSVPTGSFRIEVQAASLTVPPSGGSAPSLIPVIDDIFFMPENATMTSFDYQIPFGASTVTSATGEASHTVYDGIGRVKYIMDRDRNIVKRNTYKYEQSPDPLTASFAVPSNVYINAASTFEAATNDCVQGVTYSWNWGSGFETGTQNQSHTFTQTGVVTVTLKVSHAQYGNRTISHVFEVEPTPVTVSICAKGVMEYNSSTSSIVSSYSCAAITATPPTDGVIFKVTETTGCTDDCTYEWRMREYGGASWVIVGTGLQYTYPKVVPGQKSIQVMCTVKKGGGASSDSSPMDVIVNN